MYPSGITLNLMIFVCLGNALLENGKASSSAGYSPSPPGGIQHDSGPEIPKIATASMGSSFSSSEEPFVPTNQWQVIKEGQAIPPGLHVRLDMTTGLRVAKLMDPEEKHADHGMMVVPDSASGGDPSLGSEPSADKKDGLHDRGVFLKQELEEALKNIDKINVVNGFQHNATNVSDNARKFRTMSDIKKDFDELNLNVRTDREILKELVTKLDEERRKEDKLRESIENQLTILQDLEYMVHQIDNALDFVDMGGLDHLHDFLHSANKNLSIEAAHVIGSAAQSNVKVQIKMLEAGIIHSLVQRLEKEYNGYQKSEDSDKANFEINAISRYLYGLSAAIRGFPLAQRKFIDVGGVGVLNGLLNSPLDHPKIRNKVLTLVNDMLIERRNALEPMDNLEISVLEEKRRQYEATGLEKALLQPSTSWGWCLALLNLAGRAADGNQCDPVILLHNIRLTRDICQKTFVRPFLRKNFVTLCNHLHALQHLHGETSTDDYNTEAALSCDKLLIDLDREAQQIVRDEL